MEKKVPVEGCSHHWQQVGYWDGKDEEYAVLNGPSARCTECDGTTYFTWNEWQALPEEIKTELEFPRTTS